jgi:hypothetical protein
MDKNSHQSLGIGKTHKFEYKNGIGLHNQCHFYIQIYHISQVMNLKGFLLSFKKDV